MTIHYRKKANSYLFLGLQVGKWEGMLIKDNITGNQYVTIRDETFITFVVETISKESVGNGPELQLVVVGGLEVGVAHATRDFELKRKWIFVEENF